MRILFQKYQTHFPSLKKNSTESINTELKSFIERLDLQDPKDLPELFCAWFELLEQKNPFLKIERIQDYCYRVSLKSANHNKTTTILSGIHGNEIGGIVSSMFFAKWISQKIYRYSSHQFIFCLGNIEAIRHGKRFIKKDLNRSFQISDTEECDSKHAARIAKAIDIADVVIDLHQTVQPSTTPFFCCYEQKPTLDLLSKLECEIPILTYRQDFSTDGWTTEDYAKDKRIICFTLETGRLGIDLKQLEFTQLFLEKYLSLESTTANRKIDYSNLYKIQTTIKQNQPKTLHLVHGFKNFSKVKPGQILGFDESTNLPVISESGGYILFPKYGDLSKSSSDLALIVKKVSF